VIAIVVHVSARS